jgi:hypothetical protein
MQEGPDELSRDVLETELEVRMLINSVVTGVERQPADEIALGLGDLGRCDHAR